MDEDAADLPQNFSPPSPGYGPTCARAFVTTTFSTHSRGSLHFIR